MKTSKRPQDAINLMLEFIWGLVTTSIGQYFNSGRIKLTTLKVNIYMYQ